MSGKISFYKRKVNLQPSTFNLQPSTFNLQLSVHSVLKLVAGFTRAAFAEWNIAVADAVITITKAETINGNTDKPVLYGNKCNQLYMKYQATGNAMKTEINASHK